MDENAKSKKATYMRRWRAKNLDRSREISRAGNAKYYSRVDDRIMGLKRAASARYRDKRKADPIAHRAFLNALARRRYAAKVRADPNYAKRKALHGKKWRTENPELAKQVAREATRKWRAANPDKVREQIERSKPKRFIQQLEKRKNMRAAILDFFGGKCLRCGFSDPRALHLDHINGDGNKERKVGKGNKWDQYRLILSDPETARARYQLLCANCNTIKQVERGEYRRCLA